MLTVSLTSIPPRFPGLGPVLAALAAQPEVGEVRLTLPRRFRDFPGDHPLPGVPDGVRLIQTETDLGPATKLLPALADTKGPLLICDDDWHYGPGWAAAFLAAARDHPKHALSASTFDSARIGAPGGTIVQGFAGVLLWPDMLPPEVHALPARFRPVDDIWLSGMLALAGTPVAKVPAARALCRPSGNEADPLQHRTDRAALNRACAAHLQKTYGIWPPI